MARQTNEYLEVSRRDRGFRYALLLLLACLATLYFAWPVWRSQWPIEIDGNEAWNAFLATRFRSGLPLYPDSSELISNNYPPLSFILINWISGLGGSPILTGRILSLISTVAAAAGVSAIVRVLGGGWAAAAVGGLWYLATMARFFDTYVGMNDPNLVALALMMWGLAWTIYAQKRGRSAAPAFMLMAVAGFYKHNLLAIPLTAFVWLLAADWRAALRAGLAGVITALVGLTVCAAVFGHNFIEQLTVPRVIDLHRPISGFGRLQWVIPAFVVWAYWACVRHADRTVFFTATFILLSAIDHFIQQIGAGVDDNSQFQLIAAIGVGVALAYDSVPPPSLLQRGQITILIILIARLVLNNRVEPYLLVGSDAFRSIGPSATAVARSEARRIAAIPGDVSCTIMTICYDAGKAFVFYPFSVTQRLALGLMTDADLQARVATRQIVFETMDPRADMRGFREAARGIR